MSIDFWKFLLLGSLGNIGRGATRADIEREFGPPSVFTPARKSYPTFMVYGDLEFHLRADQVTLATLTFTEGPPQLPEGITIDGFPPETERRFENIRKELLTRNIRWERDEIMSDEWQQVFRTERGVHLVFGARVLGKLGIEYA